MPYRRSFRLLACCVAGLFALVACTALDPDVPRGFDLTGAWVLDQDSSDAPPDVDAIRRREDRDVIRGRQSDASASAAFAVQDFPVLTARRLEIEQDDESMGIRYDGVVYRDITWGERKRDLWTVRAGWAEGDLVIRSVRGRTKGRESFALERNGALLRVTVSIETDGEDVRSVRVYRRNP
ncbi:MAG: hypothetical protein OXK76_01510 [Gammaproteobacteria bacterium]|nr:hypothetical protein [Gammaproteobacteria bacterium]